MAELQVRVDVDWAERGDQWLAHLRSMVRLGGYEVFGENGEADYLQCHASDPRLRSWLMVTPTKDGQIECTIVDDEEPCDGVAPFADQIGPWRQAVEEAAARVGTPATAVWNAVLSVRPHPSGGDTASALTGETIVGPVRLVPGGVLMHEMLATHRYGLGEDHFLFPSWPLILEGTAACYGQFPGTPAQWWPMDRDGALRLVYRAAGLLSLAWDECWIVRQEPVRVTPGERVAVPHLAAGCGRDQWSQGCDPPAGHDGVPRRERDLPSWAGSAWALLDADPALNDAVTAYYEAVQLEAEHPSVAAVLYVTVIEGIGAGLVDLTPCETCGMSKGAFKRFYKALRTVMDRKAADALAGSAYERRSRTAHVGVLHGAENALGHLPDYDFRIADAAGFEDELADLAQAARAVLITALTDRAVLGPARTEPGMQAR